MFYFDNLSQTKNYRSNECDAHSNDNFEDVMFFIHKMSRDCLIEAKWKKKIIIKFDRSVYVCVCVFMVNNVYSKDKLKFNEIFGEFYSLDFILISLRSGSFKFILFCSLYIFYRAFSPSKQKPEPKTMIKIFVSSSEQDSIMENPIIFHGWWSAMCINNRGKCLD